MLRTIMFLNLIASQNANLKEAMKKNTIHKFIHEIQGKEKNKISDQPGIKMLKYNITYFYFNFSPQFLCILFIHRCIYI